MASGSDSGLDKFVQKIDFSAANLEAVWSKFKSQFKIFALARGFGKLNDEEQIANMLVCMGSESVSIYEQFICNDAHKRTLNNVISDFDSYFQPVKNVIFERMMFNQIVQKPGQLIHQFITEVQSQAGNCEFGKMTDELVRDRIVVGVREQKLREYLVDIDDLDLSKCISKAKHWTSNRSQMAQVDPDANVDALATNKVRNKDKKNMQRNKRSAECMYCAKEQHDREKCPARNTKCVKCGLVGHWYKSKICKAENKNDRRVKVVTEELEEVYLHDDDSELYLGSVSE